MEMEQILLQFRTLFNADFGFEVFGNTYLVSAEGICEGMLETVASQIEEEDICLMFSEVIQRDSGIDFLITLLRDFSGVREGHSDINGILTGVLMESEYPEVVDKIIGKRMDYLKISTNDDYAVGNLIEATLTDAIWVKDTFGYIVFVEAKLEGSLIEGLVATIQTELFEDCQWLIGHSIEGNVSIYEHGNWIREGVKLVATYALNETVISLESIVPYRVIEVCPDAIKKMLLFYNFNIDLALDEELVATIEMLFEQELNLTDTAKALFIHRNTLLYRIEKIQKLTGFDLRKFSESFIFKILWLLNKK